MVGMAVRRTPLRRLTISEAPTTSAPVLPAETKASPLPSLSACMPTAIELSAYSLSRVVGSASTGIIPCASKISMPSSGRLCSLAHCSILSRSPTSRICTPYSRCACSEPSIIASGALSPPKASTMIFIVKTPLSVVSSLRFHPPFAGMPAGSLGPAGRFFHSEPSCPEHARATAAKFPCWRPSAESRRYSRR